jgi:hypothetical protein
MNALLSYFWPLAAAGFVIGAIGGSIGFRIPREVAKARLEGEKLATDTGFAKKRWMALAIGAAATIAVAGLWAGPMHAADLFTERVERAARITLNNYEMYKVTAHLHRAPLSRRLMLAGPGDDFQRSELMRIMALVPGVREARWSGGGGLPLIAESALVALLGFLLGLLLAYLVELRRRYNAQWDW